MPIIASASGLSAWKERRFRRFNVECSVFMKFISGGSAAEVEAITKNISIGGFLAESVSMIPLHTALTFRVCVRPQEMGRSIHLAGEGDIVRVENSVTDGVFAIAVNCCNLMSEFEEHLLTEPGVVN